MPELPEVETVRVGLQRLLPGKTISGVTFDTPKSFPNAQSDVSEFLVGARVLEVKRRAKALIIELSSKYALIIHLKMTGQLVFIGKKQIPITSHTSLGSADKSHATRENTPLERFGAGHPNDSLIGELPDRSTRVTLDLGDATLFFNDQRKFGWMRLLPTTEVPNIDFMKKLGPEPLADHFTAQAFKERLLRRAKSGIKSVLLDQTVVAGVGNIYADESLWAAKIHPLTRVNKISTAKVNKLFTELQAVLRLSIEKGGSSDRNYVNAEGKKGSYISFAKVFRKEGSPCQRCGTTIVKTRVAGRGTHLCPHCQKEVI